MIVDLLVFTPVISSILNICILRPSYRPSILSPNSKVYVFLGNCKFYHCVVIQFIPKMLFLTYSLLYMKLILTSLLSFGVFCSHVCFPHFQPFSLSLGVYLCGFIFFFLFCVLSRLSLLSSPSPFLASVEYFEFYLF